MKAVVLRAVCGHLLSVVLPALGLSGCALMESPGGRIGLLVLLPLLFVALLLWAIRLQRRGRLPERDDQRGYPDYDDRD